MKVGFERVVMKHVCCVDVSIQTRFLSSQPDALHSPKYGVAKGAQLGDMYEQEIDDRSARLMCDIYHRERPIESLQF